MIPSIAIVAGLAATLAVANRWRGSGDFIPWLPSWLRRPLCALLVSLPALWAAAASTSLLGALYAAAGLGLACWLVGLAHGPGLDLGTKHGSLWGDVLYMSGTGLAFVAGPAAALALQGSVPGAALLVAGGALKGPLYLAADRFDRRFRPERKAGKYLTRELLFGFVLGALCGVAILV